MCGRIIQQTSDDDVCEVTEAEKEAADEDAEKKQVASLVPSPLTRAVLSSPGFKEQRTAQDGRRTAPTRLTRRCCRRRAIFLELLAHENHPALNF